MNERRRDDETRPEPLSGVGAYLLPRPLRDPQSAAAQARLADEGGLGTIWLNERWGTRDFASVAGAVAQATERVRIAASVAHTLVRNPAVLASLAMTGQAITGGRLVLCFGRAVGPMWKPVGVPFMTNRILVDTADVVRRLCRGEEVSYDGPAGRLPATRLPDLPALPPPSLLLAAMGPRSLALAGRHFDGVLLHPCLTAEEVERSADAVRMSAAEAGRDPAAVRIYATVMVAPDLPPILESAGIGTGARRSVPAAGLDEQLVATKGWDAAPLARLRLRSPAGTRTRPAADPHAARAGIIDPALADETEIAGMRPGWLPSSAAVGSAAQCAARLRAYLDAGADELVLHGSTPERLGPVLAHYTASL